MKHYTTTGQPNLAAFNEKGEKEFDCNCSLDPELERQLAECQKQYDQGRHDQLLDIFGKEALLKLGIQSYKDVYNCKIKVNLK